ncbi:MAG TPA: hypothetical protein VF623_06630 [Segetibacter sp.]|jgi:hypothetical protein
MEDNNKSKVTKTDVETTTSDAGQQPTQQGGANSGESNPQEGQQWNNYQTKELSSNPDDGSAISAEEAAKVFEKGE